jgi:GAF domain-containing protein
MSQTAGFDHDLLEVYGELNRDRLMELVVRYARDRLDAGGSSIFLRDDITGRYVLRGTTGILGDAPTPAGRIEYEPGEGLTGWVAKHGQPLRIANPMDGQELRRIAADLTWSKKYSEVSTKSGLAYLGVPILSRDGSTVLGVLRASRSQEGAQFDEQGEELLSHVAAMVGIAIENSQRYEREKRRARYFQLLLDISSKLDPRSPIVEMLQGVVDQVRQGFRTEACQIYLRAEENVHQVVLRAARGLPATLIGKVRYLEGEGLTGHIVRTAAAIQVREARSLDAWHDPHVAEIASHLPTGFCRSFLGVPLRLGDEVLGTLELVNKIPSAPGHRDWFTDDDEEYLRLLSTAIGGVLEGARYLKALNDVSVTTMRMQQIAFFGTLAQRILHETANPLAVARLAAANLQQDLQGAENLPPPLEVTGAVTGPHAARQSTQVARRLDIIENSLDKVSSKLLDLLNFSQRVGFARTATDWNSVVREVLIWLAAERQRRGVEMRVIYGDLPPLSIEPNELFGVLVTILRLTMEALGPQGGLVEVRTSMSAGGQQARTEIHAPVAPLASNLSDILESAANVPEGWLPLRFEWALAQETVEVQYRGSLSWEIDTQRSQARFVLELPAKER